MVDSLPDLTQSFYDGFEIDMLSLGDADSILVTAWRFGVPTRILIDGGRTESTEAVRTCLRDRDITHIAHVVCSHPHEDHASGLVGLVEDRTLSFGHAWVHQPSQHIDVRTTRIYLAVFKAAGVRESDLVIKSLDTTDALLNALQCRGIPIAEPFAGRHIGFLTVCGPSVAYYEEIVAGFQDVATVREAGADDVEPLVKAFGTKAAEAEDEGLLDNPTTDPENNSSTILGVRFDGRTYLFTADAGVPALDHARLAYDIGGSFWMQIPHHGSRRNVTVDMIDYFSPDVAYVSAIGNEKHPRQAVVDAFKDVGTQVYSTHTGGGAHLWHRRGIAPERDGYGPATPL